MIEQRFSIGDEQSFSLGFFRNIKLQRKYARLLRLAQEAINEKVPLAQRLEYAHEILEDPAQLGFVVDGSVEKQRIIRNPLLGTYPPPYPSQVFHSRFYGMLNSIAANVNGEHPRSGTTDAFVDRTLRDSGVDAALENRYRAVARALLKYDFHKFLLDASTRGRTELFDEHPMVDVSHGTSNAFPIEYLRLSNFMKKYGVSMEDVAGASNWSEV